jgi:hypothetical protein
MEESQEDRRRGGICEVKEIFRERLEKSALACPGVHVSEYSRVEIHCSISHAHVIFLHVQ